MAESLSPADREKLYTEYLRAEGYRPDEELDGVVCFRKGDLHLHLPVTKDPDYFLLALLDVHSVLDDADRHRVVRAANRVTAEAKVAKVCIDRVGDVTIDAELFCVPAEAFKTVFGRCLDALASARSQFQAAYDAGAH